MSNLDQGSNEVRSSQSRQRYGTLLIALSFEGGLALLAWPLGWLLGQPALQTWTWSLRDTGLGVAASVPMLGVGLVLARWPIGPLIRIRKFFEEVVQPFFQSCTVLDLAAISVVAGLGEEMLLRGVIQGALARWLGVRPALALASAIFGLVHAITLTYILLAVLAGAYLGLVWLTTGNLLTAVVTHAVYDFVMLVFLLRNPSGDDPAVFKARQGSDGKKCAQKERRQGRGVFLTSARNGQRTLGKERRRSWVHQAASTCMARRPRLSSVTAAPWPHWGQKGSL